MPAQYFVDSWFLIASIDRHDSHHLRIPRLERLVGNAPLVTHDAIFTEVLAFFADEGARMRAAAVQAIRRSMRRVEVIASSSILEPALDLYERRPDKEYSLVDCMSMIIMRERGIEFALTNDHHFRQEGFTVLSDAS